MLIARITGHTMIQAFRRRHRTHAHTHYVLLNTHACQACWNCVQACPNGVIGKVDIFFHKHAHIDHAEACKGCLKCVKACPHQAIFSLIPPKITPKKDNTAPVCAD